MDARSTFLGAAALKNLVREQIIPHRPAHTSMPAMVFPTVGRAWKQKLLQRLGARSNGMRSLLVRIAYRYAEVLTCACTGRNASYHLYYYLSTYVHAEVQSITGNSDVPHKPRNGKRQCAPLV